MNYLSGYKTNPQVRKLHNVKAVQSRQGWKMDEFCKAIADANGGIASEICACCGKLTPPDCEKGTCR
jgi:hypothetical protein